MNDKYEDICKFAAFGSSIIKLTKKQTKNTSNKQCSFTSRLLKDGKDSIDLKCHFNLIRKQKSKGWRWRDNKNNTFLFTGR